MSDPQWRVDGRFLMLLSDIKIGWFRNFTEPQQMAVDPAVTCLIGKNESGKTTILQALHRLNPANSHTDFNVTVDYPRRHLARHRKEQNLPEVEPITGTFTLEPDDHAAVGRILGFTPPVETVVTATRSYDMALWIDVRCGLQPVVDTLAAEASVDRADLAIFRDVHDPAVLETEAKELAKHLTTQGHVSRAAAVRQAAAGLEDYAVLLGQQGLTEEQVEQLIELLPKFFYFDDYALLQGECDLNELAQRVASGSLLDGDETMLALLRLAGEEPKNLLDEEYVTRKAELQAAGSDLTDKVMTYWTQNPDLSVRFDDDMPVVGRTPEGHEIRHRFLKIQLNDARHNVDTNFSTRSSGFRWFFSFLAAFSDYQGTTDRVVVLLDEPGTSLHGEAQRDFLSYIFQELGPHQQVLYTTHSQHMLDPTRYETMRAVHDRATRQNPNLGVVITPVNLSADPTTVLPVEAALGYSVAQHLFLGKGPHLAVEGSSDFVFLMRMSAHLAGLGRIGLDPRLSIIPVGGVGNMPAFIALMGRRLDVRALVDGAETQKTIKKIRQAAAAVEIPASKIVVIGEIDGLPGTADIEDLFTPKDYLWLYSRSGHPPLDESDLPPTGEPILRRIGQIRGEFDHAGPAHQLTRDIAEFFTQVDDLTLERFEDLFRRLAV
ncbi:AAA family ATPase [Nonomuraea angiospora]|uniref:AAA family ATPase n=1 Tax=Nonomuraea angiospora TaxID=46172 RepID=UPI0033D2BE02